MFAPIVATVTLTTEADRAAVWRALESAERWPEVLPDISAAHIEPDGRLREGSTIRTQPKPDTTMVEMAYHVLAADPRRRLVLASTAAGFDAHTEYVLADDPEGGTSVTLKATVMAEGIVMRVSTAVRRGTYATHVATSLRRRMGALLMLAETIARE